MVYREPSPVYAILGERVQLNCVISPGQLIQQYSITWERAGIAIVSSRNSPPALDDRYSVYPSDLSLIIDNVQLEEASEAYRCRLTVADPNTMQTYDYNTDSQFYNIQLIALGEFRIIAACKSLLKGVVECLLVSIIINTKEPTPKIYNFPIPTTRNVSYLIKLSVIVTFIISAIPVINGPPTENITIEGHNVSFTCSVRGFPAPVIKWQLNGIPFSSANHTRQDGSYLITSSTLMITEVTFEMTGEVRCIGRIPPAVTGDRILNEVNSTTTLIVYCKLVILSIPRSEIIFFVYVCTYAAPPSIDRSRLRDSIVAVGENVSFECSARGYPPPMITWFLNESKVLPQDTGIEVYERISQSDPYNVTTSRLQITPAQTKHNGKVQCLATINTEIDLPNDNKTVELVVLGKLVGLCTGTRAKG